MTNEKLRKAIEDILGADQSSRIRLQRVCDFLREEMDSYDWVGFYLVDVESDSQLVLGPYAGAATEHTRIGFGEGICGQAASTLKVFIVDDVKAESNYLSCSPDVRSEFVAPVLFAGELVGELDLDSSRIAAFDETDAQLLEWVAEAAAEAVADTAGFQFAE